MADSGKHPILAAVEAQVSDVNQPFMMAVHLRIKAGAREAFEAAFEECIAQTRKEAGCIAYDLNRSAADRQSYINYERWASIAALDAHLQAAHTVKLLAAAGPMLEGPPEVKVYALAGE